MPKTATLDLDKFTMTEAVLYEAKWTAATRAAYYKDHPENFAGDGDDFPIRDASDVNDAWRLAGHADDPDAVRSKIKSIAKRLGLTQGLPDTAKDDGGEKQEAAATSRTLTVSTGMSPLLETAMRPKKKIGTLPISWLEYNARSKNGRIYPKATCDAIFRAAQRQLAETNAPDPPTTFVSHEDANGNRNTHLIGAPVKVWQEGSKFWAHLDIADTSVARDILGLVEGRYLRSGSMRVLGVELVHDRNYDLPLVVVQEGVEPKFLGIDLTTNPGLADIAYIPQVLYESSGQPPYIESFDFEVLPFEEEAPMSVPLYLQVIAGTITEGMTADRQAHQRIHDHLAGVMDSAVKECHGNESANFKALVEGQLDEAGRAIAQKHAVAIAAAHDEAAKQCGMECEGCYKEALGIPLDPDRDGDSMDNDTDNDNESVKGKKVMTEAEMLAALKAKGYQVEAPKTVEEQLAELRAQTEAQSRELAVLKAGTSTPTQRQTQSPSMMTESNDTYQPEPMYASGDYLRTSIHPRHWRALAGNGAHQNRAVPWPKDADPWSVVKEMAPIMALGMLEQEAAMSHREITAFVGMDEHI